MPRINIEDKWFRDPRRERLAELLKVPKELADGWMLTAIRLAQQYWIPNKELIPIKTWSGCGMPKEFIEVGLAELREDGQYIYLSGAEEHFAWWFKKQEAGRQGGLKSSNQPRDRAGHFTPRAPTEHRPSKAEHTPSEPEQARPSSSSSSSSSKEKNIYTGGAAEGKFGCWEVFALWNQHCPPLHRAATPTRNRLQVIAERLQDHPSRKEWEVAIANAAKSKFCTGKTKEKWVATLDWLLKPDVLTRCIEGQFGGAEAKDRVFDL